ncbi:hypothetical protein GCM10010156_70200 [Planobispora rosea]|uniref:AB hydrolase-1 domain-containing protein n=1 Tax=Planobispora rosea TaxID=35762 RepID=A0A8J3WGE2_PLARO|nr:alpha/beta fold hydrolase [Planobispora rosea]GGT02215.1 hypothetical protein GCM10010156_70200 [Planobispora rosea]GIH88445.1 hypothetical protein Pro02_68530 [Planobispora rosea]
MTVARRISSVAAVMAVVAALAATGGCARQPEWGSVMEAAGQRQRVECAGTVGPAVVLVHGIGDTASSASFDAVRAELPDDRRTCRYDRPGTGDSPAPTRPGRDADALDRELDAVVRQAGGPVVLVGHSFGSYPVLYYALRHRERVAGVVLLDGVDPRLGLRAALGVTSLAEAGMGDEALDLAAVEEQVRAAVGAGPAPLADTPLVVVRRDRSLTPQWTAAQERLAALSTGGSVVPASGSGHEVPHDAPSAVVDAIARVAG